MRRRRISLLLAPVVAVGAVGAALPAAAGAPEGTTERVSVTSDGRQTNAISGRFRAPAVSSDSRVVAFDSESEQLDPDDGNGFVDAFVHDRTTGETDLVSVNDAGVPGNGHSQGVALDADGTVVAFDSLATNFAPGDRNSTHDVFVRDRMAGTTEIVSANSAGRVGNAESFDPDITPRGRYVLFLSAASNLVRGDDNNSRDMIVFDRLERTHEIVSRASDGTLGNNFASGGTISDSGRYVAFGSFANNLVPGDENFAFDVFWHDRVTGETQLVSQSTTGARGDGPSGGASISGDGRYVAFYSDATTLVPEDENQARDIFVRDVVAGTTERVSVSSAEEEASGSSGFGLNAASGRPSISADGRYVAFESAARNLVPDDTNERIDVFRRDRVEGTTIRLSVSDVETQADGDSYATAVDATGDVTAFISLATNLVQGDTNRCGSFTDGECPDVFVRDLRAVDARW